MAYRVGFSCEVTRGRPRMRWLDGITDSMDTTLSELRWWWWTGRPGMLRFMGSQRVGHDWATELNWTELIIDFLFCWNIYRVSDWTFKIKQGWETHTKGLSQILPNKSRWILLFLRSQKFLEIFLYPWDNLPNSFDKLTGNLRTSNFWRSQIERKYNCFVYNV